MKKLLKEYKIFISVLAIPYVLILICAFVKVDYDVTVPADITKVSDSLDIGVHENQQVNTVSVYSYTRVTLLNYLLAQMNPYATVEKTYPYSATDTSSIYQSGAIQKKISIYNAIIAGYEAAGYHEITDENSFQGYVIHTLYTYASTQLQLGDIIVSFNQVDFTTRKLENEFTTVCQALSYEKDKSYPIRVLRNGELLDLEIQTNYYYTDEQEEKHPSFGIATYSYTLPKQMGLDQPHLQYGWGYGNSIGPSGGLMQALYVYESLTGNTLTRGLKIVGTGTVDSYGNAGAIGGIYQKVITAHLAHADIFFVPVSSMDSQIYQYESNYQDALASYARLRKTNMKLVPIASLADAIAYLEQYK
ncbi:MAG: hypothetical protein NC182_01015 [Prevotella sp.]|nr:hypothetical protein [Staphylococcus sp.]MCM1349763.1 hypothetical protein [Prevotella sp.]